ncbi:alpha-galactosidase [Cohnella herbarum]|uniref:Alpha-galactosidase n=1 Tax=Cohnella herbarum TaxID=2728023 RepID=A0A7Z2ZP88_9BACL|nr:alpha-galactosidase [Cohnella herbarum]QJD87098.1 hypothetical protein HH215_30605 [Cohnella herbarum]
MNPTTAKEPPVAHALHRWEAETRTLHYDYGGFPLMSMYIPEGVVPYYRQYSNGNLQSHPFIQQLYLALDKPASVKISFHLSEDALNMRPHRASKGQAILGQVGRPLLEGVNGLYDLLQDLLIDWHGTEWKWTNSSLKSDDAGRWHAELEVQGGLTPWIVNLRMHYYRTHLHYRHHQPWEWRPNLQPISGWSSWEAFAQGVSAEDIERTTAFLEAHFKDYGMEYVQIDDGYQSEVIPPDGEGKIADAWLYTNERFPNGHEEIAGEFRNRGFKAGIWTSAMVTNREFAELHRDHFEKDSNGDPLYGPWIFYVLKGNPEALAEHVAPFYQALREQGYEYFKTDQIRHYLFDGLHNAVNDGLITSEEASNQLREYLRCAREAIGDDSYFLVCWGVLTEAVGLVDACRIAGDSNASWTAVCKQMVESARWFHTQRILYLNDPDYVCVRTDEAWGRSLLSLVSLSGGLLMLSDKTELYDQSRIHAIQRCFPSLSTVTGETGPLDATYPLDLSLPQAPQGTIDEAFARALLGLDPDSRDPHPTASLWSIHFDTPSRRWCVAGRFAVVPLEEAKLELQALALAPNDEYHAFDFWKQRYIGKITKSIRLEALELGHCQIVGLYKAEDRPQLIGSSRHVSMDAVSVQDERWENHSLLLELRGVLGTTEHYWIAVPSSYKHEEHWATGLEIAIANCESTDDGNLLKLSVRFDQERGEAAIRFSTESDYLS